MKNKSIFRSEAPHQARSTESSTSKSRALILDHYEQHLRTSTNRNGRPYTLGTISGYMRAARHLVTWLDDQSAPG